ncbi:uncharacterized protein FIBRA_01938 [Fibroporia radiculosa]|uniref:Tyrosine specific protein phosphatases domain-containing protein n=1 Tax=Fibroporia radiculosa TaxID=599839 RepID=J4G195_9APHY|nr:uncharacterized protein FIBRA_01938 [Fibroporia radiculosa]CCL99913.1 predicted protein [Fibroporia radiculosa]
MTDASPIPDWLMSCRSPEHLVNVLDILAQRERARARARTTSYKRSSKSIVERLTQTLPTGEEKGDLADYYSVSAGCSKENEEYNRYIDIAPYDRTRVVVSYGAAETGDAAADSSLSQGRYLNANWVRERAGGKWWIAAQAPLPQTAHAFLSTIIHTPAHPYAVARTEMGRIRTVVQLTQNVERGIQKAHTYFPTGDGQTFTVPPEEGCTAPALTVTLLRTVGHADAQCVQSTVSVVPETLSPSAAVVFEHLLFCAWPDQGVPRGADRGRLLRFVRLVDETNRAGDADAPVLLHCSAGVGRTGTFIALASLLRAHGLLARASAEAEGSERQALPRSPLGALPEALQDDLVAQEIDMLREQRPGMVERAEQVAFVYDMLAAALKTEDGDAA